MSSTMAVAAAAVRFPGADFTMQRSRKRRYPGGVSDAFGCSESFRCSESFAPAATQSLIKSSAAAMASGGSGSLDARPAGFESSG